MVLSDKSSVYTNLTKVGFHLTPVIQTYLKVSRPPMQPLLSLSTTGVSLFMAVVYRENAGYSQRFAICWLLAHIYLCFSSWLTIKDKQMR